MIPELLAGSVIILLIINYFREGDKEEDEVRSYDL